MTTSHHDASSSHLARANNNYYATLSKYFLIIFIKYFITNLKKSSTYNSDMKRSYLLFIFNKYHAEVFNLIICRLGVFFTSEGGSDANRGNLASWTNCARQCTPSSVHRRAHRHILKCKKQFYVCFPSYPCFHLFRGQNLPLAQGVEWWQACILSMQ